LIILETLWSFLVYSWELGLGWLFEEITFFKGFMELLLEKLFFPSFYMELRGCLRTLDFDAINTSGVWCPIKPGGESVYKRERTLKWGDREAGGKYV